MTPWVSALGQTPESVSVITHISFLGWRRTLTASTRLVFCLTIAIGSPTAEAQTIIDLSEIGLCADCRLPLQHIVSLGTATGAGMIEEEWTRAIRDAEMGYLTFAGATIKRFDEHGQFVGQIGRTGEGPGEFRAITDVQIVRGQIVALDYRNRSWSVFDADGRFLRLHRYSGALGRGRFHVVGEDTVVVAGMDTSSPEVVGYPLHLTRLASPDASVVHFGAESPDYIPSEPYARSVVLGTMSHPGTVWWGKPARPHWEEWSLDGDHLRTVVGDLPWFPNELPAMLRGPKPISRMGYFGVDGRDRLWILTEVPDSDWEDIEFAQTDEGWVPVERVTPSELRDARLDVFDLKARRHLGHFRWDGVYPALLTIEGDMAVSAVEYDTDFTPRLAIYRLPRGFPDRKDIGQ